MTDREARRDRCPTCGISRYYIMHCHPSNLAAINACPDRFHKDVLRAMREAMERL